MNREELIDGLNRVAAGQNWPALEILAAFDSLTADRDAMKNLCEARWTQHIRDCDELAKLRKDNAARYAPADTHAEHCGCTDGRKVESR